ncbi:MAG TPA: SEL1-like repeat protein [Telluria sp.]|nr:SEL1-like repeat protein [Telluria sp.]
MANREELGIIRMARSGKADAQLQLGKLYLFGGSGLPRSATTALHWLERAAQQGCEEAWMAIGAHVPFETAQQHGERLSRWFERAWEGGLARAGVVFARLVLQDGAASEERRRKARCALEDGARAGLPDAQWMLTTLVGANPAAPARSQDAWLQRAAVSGVQEARFALANQAWEEGDTDCFIAQALPLARELAAGAHCGGTVLAAPSAASVKLLSRCARALESGAAGRHDPAEALRFYELAANENDPHAQLAVGLHCARMRIDGERVSNPGGAANFRKAIRWLNAAAEQGLAQAWYALSRIYIKSEFSQRSLQEANRFLERAAEMGYRDAQLELGLAAWRARREKEDNDVCALYWLKKAAAQGCRQAAEMLEKIAPRPGLSPDLPPPGALDKLSERQPLLAARLALAGAFGLSRAEALLLDVNAANHGHCLVVDIRGSYGRGKRRLVLVQTERQRTVLANAQRLFDGIDSTNTGPEGNYRQRLYRLKTWLAAQPAPAPSRIPIHDDARQEEELAA